MFQSIIGAIILAGALTFGVGTEIVHQDRGREVTLVLVGVTDDDLSSKLNPPGQYLVFCIKGGELNGDSYFIKPGAFYRTELLLTQQIYFNKLPPISVKDIEANIRRGKD